MKMDYKHILILLVVAGVSDVFSSVIDTDSKEKNQLFVNDDNGEKIKYGKDFKDSLSQLEKYIEQEADNISDINDDDLYGSNEIEDTDIDIQDEMQHDGTKTDDFQLIEEEKGPFVMSNFKFGKKISDDSRIPYANNHLFNDEQQMANDDDNFLKETKRPFVLNGGYRGRYKFGKRSHNDEDFIYEKKRPFVLGGGRFKFGKRRMKAVNFMDEQKRPFVFSKFGKRLSNANSHYDIKRPFVFSNFGKRQLNNDEFHKDEKIPFVLRRGNKFEKQAQKEDERLTGEIIDQTFNLEDRNRIAKRPFVMGGSFSRFRKIPNIHDPSIRKHKMFIGSGFRFGKRGYLDGDKQRDSTTGSGKVIANPFEISLYKDHDFDTMENNDFDTKVPFWENSEYNVEKRPFVLQGLFNKHKRPLNLKDAWKQPFVFGPGFRFGKRNDKPMESDVDIFDDHEKRPFVLSYGKRRHGGPGEEEKRFFTFRHDFHSDKVRQQAQSNFGKRPFVFGKFGKRFDPSEDKYHFNARPSYEDQQIYKTQNGFNDNLNLPFHLMKKPFIISGNYRSKIGKRPFVISGSRSSYKFGK